MTFKIPLQIPLILLRQLGQEVNRFICFGKLLRQPPDLILKHLDLSRLRIIVPNRLVRNVTRLTRILHRANVFFYVGVAGVQASDHKAETVSTETLPE